MNASRREFLKRAAAVSASGVAAPLMLNLSALAEAAAQSADDYKALVCVFMNGGNDCHNSIVPYDDESYAAYSFYRQAAAFGRDVLAPLALVPDVALPGGRAYALSPHLQALLPHFNAGRMNVLMNVGPLVQPLSKADYELGRAPLPPKLFSHNDQISIWQSLQAEGALSGWGGRMGDVFASGNGKAVFTSINMAGNAVFASGSDVTQLQLNPGGPVSVTALGQPIFGSAECSAALRELITSDGSHAMEREWTRVTRRGLQAQIDFQSALDAAGPLTASFPANNSLASQLAMVVRLIMGRQALGARRQVFLVQLGGFDHHLGLLSGHRTLLTRVGEAMAAFQAALDSLGLAEQVTTFSASDFGRALNYNGAGTDHGWGSMHWVLGGALQPRQLVGEAPVIAVDGPNDVGSGRLLPTTSVDQLAAAFGSWMGVSDSQLLEILPNWKNFVDPLALTKPQLPLFRSAAVAVG